jgi:hypothetical protein
VVEAIVRLVADVASPPALEPPVATAAETRIAVRTSPAGTRWRLMVLLLR